VVIGKWLAMRKAVSAAAVDLWTEKVEAAPGNKT